MVIVHLADGVGQWCNTGIDVGRQAFPEARKCRKARRPWRLSEASAPPGQSWESDTEADDLICKTKTFDRGLDLVRVLTLIIYYIEENRHHAISRRAVDAAAKAPALHPAVLGVVSAGSSPEPLRPGSDLEKEIGDVLGGDVLSVDYPGPAANAGSRCCWMDARYHVRANF